MPYIENFINEIDKTHSNLGKLVAISQLSIKARKFTLLISPSGCGKSVVMDYLAQNTADSWSPMSLSIASLGNKVEKMTSFRSGIFIDDIATIQTMYARTTTITTLSALCYTHRVEPSMVGFDFAIEDFYGSALVGIQPIILRDLVLYPEWDASIKDKALRYYHMYRPVTPEIKYPKVEIQWGIDIEQVEFEPDLESPDWLRLILLARSQWSRARSKEHIIDLLKGVASLEGRKKVIEADYHLLYDLLKPMAIENIVSNRDELEGDNILNKDLLLLLVQYYTYGGNFSLADVVTDFGIKFAMGYRIMAGQNGHWKQYSKSPSRYRASDFLVEMLQEYNLDLKGEK